VTIVEVVIDAGVTSTVVVAVEHGGAATEH